jgi:hypothetical protein
MAIVLNGTTGITGNSGTLISASTIGVGGATPAASGAGITFPATASASSDANTLDDYEEGVWTPTLTASSGSFSSVTYTDTDSTYTKVGRIVFINCILGWSAFSVGTASGNLLVGGLPFASANNESLLTTTTFNLNWPNSGTIVGQVLTSSSIQFRVGQDNGAWNIVSVSAQGSAEQNYIRLSGCYAI